MLRRLDLPYCLHDVFTEVYRNEIITHLVLDVMLAVELVQLLGHALDWQSELVSDWVWVNASDVLERVCAVNDVNGGGYLDGLVYYCACCVMCEYI